MTLKIISFTSFLISCIFFFFALEKPEYVTTSCNVWDINGPYRDIICKKDLGNGKGDWMITFYFKPTKYDCYVPYKSCGEYFEQKRKVDMINNKNITECYYWKTDNICKPFIFNEKKLYIDPIFFTFSMIFLSISFIMYCLHITEI